MEKESMFLGDGILRRMLETLCRKRAYYINRKRCVQLCVGCQTLEQLVRRVKKNKQSLEGRKAVVLVGTNNILMRRASNALIHNLKWLVRELNKKDCAQVLICTIPPIPHADCKQKEALQIYNNAIRRVFGDNVVDVHSRFEESQLKEHQIFERDRLHPNRKGLEIIYDELVKYGTVL